MHEMHFWALTHTYHLKRLHVPQSPIHHLTTIIEIPATKLFAKTNNNYAKEMHSPWPNLWMGWFYFYLKTAYTWALSLSANRESPTLNYLTQHLTLASILHYVMMTDLRYLVCFKMVRQLVNHNINQNQSTKLSMWRRSNPLYTYIDIANIMMMEKPCCRWLVEFFFA